MNEGDVRDISDINLVSDLINAGLVENAEKTEEKPKRKSRAKK